MSTRTVRAESIIEAPPALVWEVLVDFERYPEWNPFTHEVHVDLRVGGEAELHVNMTETDHKVMTETVVCVEPGRRVAWGLSWLGGKALECARYQEVHPHGEAGSRYVTHETSHGLLGGLVMVLYGEKTRAGFQRCADAIKLRAESLNRAAG